MSRDSKRTARSSESTGPHTPTRTSLPFRPGRQHLGSPLCRQSQLSRDRREKHTARPRTDLAAARIMSQRSRADSPRRPASRSPAPGSPLTVPSLSTAPGDVTPIAPGDAEGVCPVCLDNLHPTATGGDTCVPFPTCAVHHMHLACLAQFRAQASGPSELLCPLCRHSLCPACSPGGWTGREDAALRHLCIQHGVSIPTRVSGESTVRAAVPDYALRTFTSHDAPEPRPPPGVRIPCCHHIAAIGRAGGVDFIRLPDRTMRWAPVAIRHEAGIAASQPTWVCMGCAQSEQLGDLLIPAEAGTEASSSGSTTASMERRPSAALNGAPVPAAPPPQPLARTPDPHEPPPNPHQPEPLNLHPARSHHADTRFPEAHLELQSRGAWYDQGPPERDVQSPTNSWLYVFSLPLC